jgi:hypothetical protein
MRPWAWAIQAPLPGGSPPDFRTPPVPIIPVEFEQDGLALSYFSTPTALGTPQEATLQEIRLESFFPPTRPPPRAPEPATEERSQALER